MLLAAALLFAAHGQLTSPAHPTTRHQAGSGKLQPGAGGRSACPPLHHEGRPLQIGRRMHAVGNRDLAATELKSRKRTRFLWLRCLCGNFQLRSLQVLVELGQTSSRRRQNKRIRERNHVTRGLLGSSVDLF